MEEIQSQEPEIVESHWYDNPWYVFLLFLLFFPVGIYGMAKTKKTVQVFFMLLGFFFLFYLVMKSANPNFAANLSGGPKGKSFVSQDGSIEYSFGNTQGESDDFLNYSRIYLNSSGQPIGNTHRTGHFSADGNTIQLKFDDNRPPFSLRYKEINGQWCVISENGDVLYWDDPDKRK